jgi:hypothetical protein
MAVPLDFYNSLLAISLFASSFAACRSSRWQFTILNFVRLKSWSITSYSSISGSIGIGKRGRVTALIIAALFAQRAMRWMGHVYHIRLRRLAHRLKVEWNSCPDGPTITGKIKIDAVRLSISGRRAGDAIGRSGR